MRSGRSGPGPRTTGRREMGWHSRKPSQYKNRFTYLNQFWMWLQTQLNAERSVGAWAAENRPPRKGMELAIKAAADANAHLSTNYEKAKNQGKASI